MPLDHLANVIVQPPSCLGGLDRELGTDGVHQPCFFSGWGFAALPTGFLPEEDQGYLVAGVQLHDAASLERTREVVDKINGIFESTPGIDQWVTIGGNSLLDATVSSNSATFYVILEPWEERGDSSLSQHAILANLRRQFFSKLPEGIAFAFIPPAIFGLGTEPKPRGKP